MHQVPVPDDAVLGLVLRHRRDDDAVLEFNAAHFERQQHGGRGLATDAPATSTGLKPLFVTFQPLRVAQPQVLVADALAAGEQRVGKLFDLHAGVAVNMLEPLGGVARRILDLEHLDAAARLVALQHGGHVGPGVVRELIGQVDRIFQRQLGAAADGEVCGVRCVAHQHDRGLLAGDVLMVHPGVADHARKPYPVGRTAQVLGVADQFVAIQILREQLFAERDTVFLAHLLDAVGLPHVLRRLDDEGRGVGVELVGMGLEPAVFGLFEGEGEGVKRLPGAQPDEAALAGVDVGLEGAFVAGADAAVQAVAGDDQIGVVLLGERLVIGDIGLEHELHTEFVAALLQDVEQALAADADEAVAARAHAAALVEDLDVVPVVEGVLHGLRRLGVGPPQVDQGLVGEHHPPAEGVVGPIALDHGHLQRRKAPLHQQPEVQTRRAATDAQDAPQRRSGCVHA